MYSRFFSGLTRSGLTRWVCLFMLSLTPALAQKKAEEEGKKSDSKKKSYADVVTAEAQTTEGLFKVHKLGSKYLFEISRDLLEQEILIVSRIAGHVKGLNFGGAGMKSRPQQVVRWQVLDDKVLLRSVSFNSVADFDKPIYRSVRNNNFEPIVMTFDVATYTDDSSAVVFDAGALFTTDVPMIGGLSEAERKQFQIKGLDAKRSLISSVRPFPENVEVRHVLTYTGDKLPDNRLTNTLSLEMNQSFVRLPAEPMQPRYYDDRVGYFSIQQIDYGRDEDQKALKRRYITRWRLEPSDSAAFARGELVEPVKPIVYYIDPATPEVWRPYLKKGIEDWQPAFEAAGFKNAIVAKDAPTPEEDPDWSPEDVRFSCIRYITTDIQNAQGPHVHDPRTGEILESDILWYHNVMNLLRNWYLVQTAAINPQARGVRFEPEVMGELIRFVAAHEVGHTLGLPHNMGASHAYPVDSLRSPAFTKRMGTAPSIMDYARFNYVAQPEDGDVSLAPAVGPYDKWSIMYGYKPVPGAPSADAERDTLHQWVMARAGDPLYRYGRQRGNPLDPSAQTEDLGDNSMAASAYGIKNLRRILPQLADWTAEPGRDYRELEELYGQVLGQFGRYMGHVTAHVGGVYEHAKTSDQAGAVYTPAPRAEQREALSFLDAQLFQTPTWLIDTTILTRIGPAGAMERVRKLQTQTLSRLLEPERLHRLSDAAALPGSDVYALADLFDDTRRMIFADMYARQAIDPYRRNLQRAYVDRLGHLLALQPDQFDQSDLKAGARATLQQLEKDLRRGARRQRDAAAKQHLRDLRARTQHLLSEGWPGQAPAKGSSPAQAAQESLAPGCFE